jgi:hypothetical protein
VELTGFTGNALGDDFGVFIDIDRHGFSFWSRRGRLLRPPLFGRLQPWCRR